MLKRANVLHNTTLMTHVISNDIIGTRKNTEYRTYRIEKYKKNLIFWYTTIFGIPKIFQDDNGLYRGISNPWCIPKNWYMLKYYINISGIMLKFIYYPIHN